MNKKITIFLLVFAFIFGIANLNIMNAASTKVYDDSKASYWQESSDEQTKLYGMTHHFLKGIASTGGATFNQQVNLFEMKTDGVNSKLVTWSSKYTNNSLKRATLTQIAKNYEQNHPGWIVVGGINADQFYTKYGSNRGTDGSYPYVNQTYYPLIMDGERRFPITPYGINNKFVGFTNNPSNPMVQPSALKGYSLSIVDDNGNVISKHNVDTINSESEGTSVWSSYMHGTSESEVSVSISSQSQNIYVVFESDISYININPVYGLSGENNISFFGKGEIDNIVSAVTVNKGQFAVKTNDQTLQNALQKGTKIIVQYDYVDETLNNVEAASGYHSIQRMNGVDMVNNDGYNTRQYNRSIFGRKADGTYALVTVDFHNGKTEFGGQNFTQTNAMLKAYGITEAYQDDGGGSVTAILRDENGEFQVTNHCSDGSQRSILTGLFFVVRDPSIKINNAATTRSSAEIIVEENEYNNVKDIYAEYNGKTYNVNNGKITVTDLEENTEHIIKVNYSIASKNSEEYIESYTTIKVKTLPFIYPSSGLSVSSKTNKTIEIKKQQHNQAENIRNVVVHVGDESYNMGSEYIYTIEDLIEDCEYNVYFEYDIYDPETGKTYHNSEEPFTVKTLSFEAPYITKFELYKQEENKAIFKYTYKDSDDVVKSAYILVDDISYSVNEKSGNMETTGVDFTEKGYIAKLVIEFEDQDGNVYKVESNPIELPQMEKAKGCKKKAIDSVIYLTSLISIVLFLRKKH